MRNRGLALVATVGIAVLVACGRASEQQINQALGITPTPTRTAEEIAQATAAVAATATARAAAEAVAGGTVLGDVTRGSRQFNTWCIGCHGPGGSGPNILAPGGPGSGVTPDALLALVREGTGHENGPTYKTTEISDAQVADLAAYISSEAAP